MSASKVLIYLVRRDLRVSDNPILHHLATTTDHGFTHLLPIYVFASHQIEVSGFIQDDSKSPYPEAKSAVGRFWRCGPHRAKFLTSAVWDMKESLRGLGSDLTVRVGRFEHVLKNFIDSAKENGTTIGAVWLTSDEGFEEKQDEEAVSSICASAGIEFKAWADEKYFIDDRDVKLEKPDDLPDVFTSYRKMMEPLREKPRPALPRPSASSLPKPPPASSIAAQSAPFNIPTTAQGLEDAILGPLKDALPNCPAFPEGAASAHPFHGGETQALERLDQIIKTGVAYKYKSSRNGLLGPEFSTKLSGYLAVGAISARQIHEALLQYEDGKHEPYAGAQGYGEGENEGTKGVRFELLWRDYMRLCTKKFEQRLFRRSGFRDDKSLKWKSPKKEDALDDQPQPEEVDKTLERLFAGTTGMGLIDASQRELLHTGYTSNRARQNVASFLAKHLGIDWRYGAEWYEMLLVDYDVSSNWSNWQYVAGVGNDPRGEARIFNPVKQAFDYDKEGEYVKTWVPELRKVEKLENVFQACTTPKEDWERFELTGLSMVEEPVKRIEFSVDGKPNKHAKRPFDRRRKDGRIRSNANISAQTHSNGNQAENGNAQPTQQGSYAPFDAPRNPRADFRGGRGGGRGGYRGRGYGGPRGAYRGGRGQYQNQGQNQNQYYGYVQHGPPPPAQWQQPQ